MMSTMEEIKAGVIRQLQKVYDPEIPVNIYELGLIYEVAVEENGAVTITMTLTTPNCPEAETLPPYIERVVSGVDGVRDVVIDLVWEPPWTPDRMSEAARLELGLL
jgi:FeS assembly SUF system protein